MRCRSEHRAQMLLLPRVSGCMTGIGEVGRCGHRRKSIPKNGTYWRRRRARGKNMSQVTCSVGTLQVPRYL